MARKKNTIPNGFEDILGNIYSNVESTAEVSNMDDLMAPDTPLVEDEQDDKEPPVDVTEDGDATTVATDDADDHDDNSQIPDDVLKKMNNTSNDQTTDVDDDQDVDDEPTDADVIEAQQVGLLFDAVGTSLGWDMSQIKEDDRPLTVDDLTKYLSEVVTANSVPQYADQRIQQLDEYVKNGGKFEDFYSRQQEAMTLDNLDLDDETNQKAVIRELLKYNNYSDEQINKKIARYEDSDMLYEESEDALDRLKQIRQYQVEQQAREQEEYARIQEEQSRAFFDGITKDINSLTNIRGINVPQEDRKALFDYIFRTDENGLTQYQKDFNANLSKNLIESAYFTMKADSLISTAKKTGESSAAEKLRKMLRHSTKNHTTYNVEDKQKSLTDLVTGLY